MIFNSFTFYKIILHFITDETRVQREQILENIENKRTKFQKKAYWKICFTIFNKKDLPRSGLNVSKSWLSINILTETPIFFCRSPSRHAASWFMRKNPSKPQIPTKNVAKQNSGWECRKHLPWWFVKVELSSSKDKLNFFRIREAVKPARRSRQHW